MLYNEFIQNIIDTRGQWSDEVRQSKRGFARHHILPKCLGGLPKTLSWDPHENIIWLYPTEHFIAHKLLAEENPNNESLVCAYKRMCYSNNIGKVATPEDFELAENLFRQIHSQHLRGKKKAHYIIKDRDAFILQKHDLAAGNKNPMYGRGDLVSGGKNGHAIRNFYYKNIKFDCMKDMLSYIDSIGLHITKSAVMRLVSGKATNRIYNMYGDIVVDIQWENKNENKADTKN